MIHYHRATRHYRFDFLHMAPAGALSTDLYEFTMAAGYHVAGDTARGTFELFVRELPPTRGYLVAAGLEPALEFLASWRFLPDQIDFLRSVPALAGVPGSFFDEYLPQLRFRGDVWAMPEGTPVFAGEPLLRVTATLAEAQLVETGLLSTVLFQTSVASRAARVAGAAAGRPVTEFGGRRAHGTDAAVAAARAAILGGCAATSNVEAGFRYRIPLAGTMAHSWVMASTDEVSAFRRYEELFGEQAVLVIDTYDPVVATDAMIAAGLKPAAVRLDSGDLDTLSRTVRARLDAASLTSTRILVSGDLDEHRVAALVASRAPIDGFGVGTALSTSSDAPSLSGVYKLVETEQDGVSTPLMKLSEGKRTEPGRKQVWRLREGGRAVSDTVGLIRESGPAGAEPLLRQVMSRGERVLAPVSLSASRSACLTAVTELPAEVRRLEAPADYPVARGAALGRLVERLSTERTGVTPDVE